MSRGFFEMGPPAQHSKLPTKHSLCGLEKYIVISISVSKNSLSNRAGSTCTCIKVKINAVVNLPLRPKRTENRGQGHGIILLPNIKRKRS